MGPAIDPSPSVGLASALACGTSEQTLHAEDKRQGRALHSDQHARVGLCQAYLTSRDRKTELPHWLHRYNWHRPHAGIGDKTPISRLGLAKDNVLRFHI